MVPQLKLLSWSLQKPPHKTQKSIHKDFLWAPGNPKPTNWLFSKKLSSEISSKFGICFPMEVSISVTVTSLIKPLTWLKWNTDSRILNLDMITVQRGSGRSSVKHDWMLVLAFVYFGMEWGDIERDDWADMSLCPTSPFCRGLIFFPFISWF